MQGLLSSCGLFRRPRWWSSAPSSWVKLLQAPGPAACPGAGRLGELEDSGSRSQDVVLRAVATQATGTKVPSGLPCGPPGPLCEPPGQFSGALLSVPSSSLALEGQHPRQEGHPLHISQLRSLDLKTPSLAKLRTTSHPSKRSQPPPPPPPPPLRGAPCRRGPLEAPGGGGGGPARAGGGLTDCGSLWKALGVGRGSLTGLGVEGRAGGRHFLELEFDSGFISFFFFVFVFWRVCF